MATGSAFRMRRLRSRRQGGILAVVQVEVREVNIKALMRRGLLRRTEGERGFYIRRADLRQAVQAALNIWTAANEH